MASPSFRAENFRYQSCDKFAADLCVKRAAQLKSEHVDAWLQSVNFNPEDLTQRFRRDVQMASPSFRADNSRYRSCDQFAAELYDKKAAHLKSEPWPLPKSKTRRACKCQSDRERLAS